MGILRAQRGSVITGMPSGQLWNRPAAAAKCAGRDRAAICPFARRAPMREHACCPVPGHPSAICATLSTPLRVEGVEQVGPKCVQARDRQGMSLWHRNGTARNIGFAAIFSERGPHSPSCGLRLWLAICPGDAHVVEADDYNLIETGCGLLPYPWGDRIEATLGNFGLWVQITLAIIVFRIFIWLVSSALRRIWSLYKRRPRRSSVGPAEDNQ